MSIDLKSLRDEAIRAMTVTNTEEELENLRVEYFGKKGKLTNQLKALKDLTPDERARTGKEANELKAELENLLESRRRKVKEAYFNEIARKEHYDPTVIPGKFPQSYLPHTDAGHIHPISIMQQKLENIFTSMGFSIMDGPQVETDFFNFGALNFTDDHPAREMQDTFYTGDSHLLRTHTSAVQVRSMQKLRPPMRVVAPGRVFRYEEIDASHEHTFYQMEGMIIDREISTANLIHTMKTLLAGIFEKEVEVRLRPGYFPFVEPGFELDMQCSICGGKGCPVCKNSGWVEVLPCGLVHPNVLKAGGLDPTQWQGAAFGLGLNRLVMMHYAIEDIRHFQNLNTDFLFQF